MIKITDNTHAFRFSFWLPISYLTIIDNCIRRKFILNSAANCTKRCRIAAASRVSSLVTLTVLVGYNYNRHIGRLGMADIRRTYGWYSISAVCTPYVRRMYAVCQPYVRCISYTVDMPPFHGWHDTADIRLTDWRQTEDYYYTDIIAAFCIVTRISVFGRISGVCQPYVGCMSAVYQPSISRMSAVYQPYISRISAVCQPYISRMSAVYPLYVSHT